MNYKLKLTVDTPGRAPASLEVNISKEEAIRLEQEMEAFTFKTDVWISTENWTLMSKADTSYRNC